MKRKLVKQGLSALTITIPSSWVRKNNLKAGDEVDVLERDTSLTISKEGRTELNEITVDLTGLLPRLADRFMARAYQKGYDRIILKSEDPDLLQAVKNKVPELMGYEIINSMKNQVEVQILSAQLDLDFDTLLRRALLILKDMLQTCHDAWKAGDKKSLDGIFYQDYDVNKFMYFCLRQLNTSQKLMTFGRSILYYLIETLEDLGDELKALGKVLAQLPPHKAVLGILNKLIEMYQLSYEFFYTPDRKKAKQAYMLSKEISELIDAQLSNTNLLMVKALISLEFSNRIIYHLTTMRLDTLKGLGGQ
ncbi:MAG TPA: AbrB/MazE/SpoVT family DNA-binding domain-containing protein [Candidatus Nanoarchaeia archaeon]|nr:AbrB/MazE/SpoVT family DNA-binding domain-containing protein [Candidatus Nanoarchaeia archaeon]